MARPSKYKKEYAELAKNYRLLGATDAQMAKYCGVTENTLNNWKKDHVEFLHALKEGKEDADAKVANSLYNRALGYSHPDIDIKVVNGDIVQTDIIKHYPPDTTSCIFWLKNRDPENWRDTHEITGDLNIYINETHKGKPISG